MLNRIVIPTFDLSGTSPQPGEISLGHNGVLFLDELPEFKRTVLEVMRQPLEDRIITILRTKSTYDYPASFIIFVFLTHLLYNSLLTDCILMIYVLCMKISYSPDSLIMSQG